MPKITVFGGTSHFGVTPEPGVKEKPWDGKPSSPSTPVQQKKPEQSEAEPRKPAPSAEPRSRQTKKAASSAPSKTTTHGRETAKGDSGKE